MNNIIPQNSPLFVVTASNEILAVVGWVAVQADEIVISPVALALGRCAEHEDPLSSRTNPRVLRHSEIVSYEPCAEKALEASIAQAEVVMRNAVRAWRLVHDRGAQSRHDLDRELNLDLGDYPNEITPGAAVLEAALHHDLLRTEDYQTFTLGASFPNPEHQLVKAAAE